MSTHVDRDRDIQLAETAERRARERMAKWNNDPKMKALMREHHDATRDLKSPPAPAKRA